MKKASLYIMAGFYMIAGINHLWHEPFYMKIMPSWLPYQQALVMISGFAEILLGGLLLFPATRRISAWGIIILLIAVFPANIQMMLNYIHDSNPHTWISILRLPIQPILIYWAYGFTKHKAAAHLSKQ